MQRSSEIILFSKIYPNQPSENMSDPVFLTIPEARPQEYTTLLALDSTVQRFIHHVLLTVRVWIWPISIETKHSYLDLLSSIFIIFIHSVLLTCQCRYYRTMLSSSKSLLHLRMLTLYKWIHPSTTTHVYLLYSLSYSSSYVVQGKSRTLECHGCTNWVWTFEHAC
jgi:hypothetical protein